MFADRQQKVQAQGVLSRSGPALAVIGVHVVLIYVISASMGIVPIPSLKPPMETVFIDEHVVEREPTPIVPDVKPPTDFVPDAVAPMAPPVETEVAPAVTPTVPVAMNPQPAA